MTPIGSLFSGYGGLDLAAHALFPGAETVWHCEWDDGPSKILTHHWPQVPNYRDVTEIDWATMPPVDILTGGYPCQPFSQAGQRKGTNDERHLWPYVREAIRHLRPRYTLLENVAGHRTLGFDRVLGDLAEDGMHVRWTSVRASDIGAPHHRERLFILVTDTSCGGPESVDGITGCSTSRRSGEWELSGGDRGLSPDAEGGRLLRQQQPVRGAAELPGDHGRVGSLPDADCIRRDVWRTASVASGRAHTPTNRHSTGSDWGTYAPAVRRWERLTRPAPAPTELNKNGRPRLNAAFAEWMMGLPDSWVTTPEIGISRAQQLKAIGNGVCPQQAIAAYASMLPPYTASNAHSTTGGPDDN